MSWDWNALTTLVAIGGPLAGGALGAVATFLKLRNDSERTRNDTQRTLNDTTRLEIQKQASVKGTVDQGEMIGELVKAFSGLSRDLIPKPPDAALSSEDQRKSAEASFRVGMLVASLVAHQEMRHEFWRTKSDQLWLAHGIKPQKVVTTDNVDAINAALDADGALCIAMACREESSKSYSMTRLVSAVTVGALVDVLTSQGHYASAISMRIRDMMISNGVPPARIPFNQASVETFVATWNATLQGQPGSDS